MKYRIFFLIIACLIWVNQTCTKSKNEPEQALSKTNSDENIFSQAREQMVRFQIENRGINDSLVLAAMRKVPRHYFVPQYQKGQAYDDNPLPIGWQQTISQPYIVAFMTEQLRLKGGEKVLEIGTGSGYQAAVLAEIAGEVYTIEIVQPLAERTIKILQARYYSNIHVKIGDGYQGWPEEAPFDAIIVTAAPNHIPQPLTNQLKPGGRMILPVGEHIQDLILVTKNTNSKIIQKRVLPVRFVPMTGEAEK